MFKKKYYFFIKKLFHLSCRYWRVWICRCPSWAQTLGGLELRPLWRSLHAVRVAPLGMSPVDWPLRVSERPRLQRAMAAWLWWWRSPLDSRSGWGSWRCRCLWREWRQMLRCRWKPPLERVRSFQGWPLLLPKGHMPLWQVAWNLVEMKTWPQETHLEREER